MGLAREVAANADDRRSALTTGYLRTVRVRLVLALAAVLVAGLLGGGVVRGADLRTSCGPSPSASPPRGPKASSRRPPAGVLAQFAVLRRPATSADRLPREALRALTGVLRSHDAAYARRVSLAAGGEPTAYLIVGRLAPPAPIAIACLPKSVRPAFRRAAARGRAAARLPAYCLVRIGAADSYAFYCGLFAAVGEGYGFGEVDLVTPSRGPPTGNGAMRVAGLVPDGVAAVELTFRGLPMTATVTDNCFSGSLPTIPSGLTDEIARLDRHLRVVRGVPRPTARQRRRLAKLQADVESYLQPSRVRWASAAGRVIRRFAPPRTPPVSTFGGGSDGNGGSLTSAIDIGWDVRASVAGR